MDFFLCLLASVLLGACKSAPQYPLYSVYLAPPSLYLHPYSRRPAVFAPQPPSPGMRRNYHAASPLVHNSITYRVDPDGEPDDALEVAQFHSQDAVGRVVFGFNTPHQSRMEARSLDGTVRGSYSYQDPTGKTVRMHYWDDGTGFHTMGNNLPASFFSPPSYTPEVQEARERHMKLYREALAAAMASGSGADEEVQQSEESSAMQPESISDPEATAPEAESQAQDAVESEDSEAVAVESADILRRVAPESVRREPIATRKQVAQPNDMTLGDGSTLVIARTGGDGYQYLVPVSVPAAGVSESLHATLYGAVPVAAVHDAQVSPAQRNSIEDHQLKPLLYRIGLGKAS